MKKPQTARLGPRGAITLLDREHQWALYAFGGGGSGAAMRLSGCAKWNDGTNCAAIGSDIAETLAPRAIVVPHDVIATQQGIAADLHGFGSPRCLAGNSLWESSWCGIAAAPDPELPPLEWSLQGASTAPTVR